MVLRRVRATLGRWAFQTSGVAARLLQRPPQYVFIVGHMRSGSSLLHHLLVSHRELLGCGELNTAYSQPDDLARLRLRLIVHHRAYWPRRYYVDQINHTRFTPQPELLDDPRLRTVFLLRQPGPSVASMVRVLGQYYGTTLAEATDYYLERVASLAALAEGLAAPQQACCVRYEDLVNDTAATLRQLQTFLHLRTPLSAEYRRFDFTGRRGDPGPNIRLGRVSREVATHHIDLPEDVLDRLQAAHAACWQTLQDCCRG